MLTVSVVADADVHTTILKKVENGNVQPRVFHSCSRRAYTPRIIEAWLVAASFASKTSFTEGNKVRR